MVPNLWWEDWASGMHQRHWCDLLNFAVGRSSKWKKPTTLIWSSQLVLIMVLVCSGKNERLWSSYSGACFLNIPLNQPDFKPSSHVNCTWWHIASTNVVRLKWACTVRTSLANPSLSGKTPLSIHVDFHFFLLAMSASRWMIYVANLAIQPPPHHTQPCWCDSGSTLWRPQHHHKY